MWHHFDSEPNHQHGFFFFLSENGFDTLNIISRPTTLWRSGCEYFIFIFIYFTWESRGTGWNSWPSCRGTNTLCSQNVVVPQKMVDSLKSLTFADVSSPTGRCESGGVAQIPVQRSGDEFVPLAVQRTDERRCCRLNTDAENSELRWRTGSGKRAGLSAGLSRSTGTQKKRKNLCASALIKNGWLCFACLSHCPSLPLCVSLSVTRTLILPHFFFLPCAKPNTGDAGGGETGGKKEKQEGTGVWRTWPVPILRKCLNFQGDVWIWRRCSPSWPRPPRCPS